LKFSLGFVLIFLFVIPPVYSKELTGIFIKFDKEHSTVTVLTRQGLVSLKFNSLSKRAFETLKNLRQGYVVKVDFENKFVKEIKLEEKPK